MRKVTVTSGWAWLACGALLTACGSTPGTTGTTGNRDALYFTTTTLPVAYLAETYEAPITVAGGAGPYTVRVGSGSLPPGLTLRNLRLSGTPTKTGAYTFTLESSDANLSSKVQSYTLNVNELPPLALKPQLPAGEIRGETRIPLNITAPRAVRAARMTWDLPEGVTVTRVQAAEAGGVLFWKLAGRTLTVDVGFKAVPRSGARVALVSLKPQKVVKLDTTRFAFEARDGAGKLLAEVKLPEAARPAATPATPNPATASPATPTTPTTTTPAAPATPAAPTPPPGGNQDPPAAPPSPVIPNPPPPATPPGGGSP
ncbi:Ig domain-containing protein [Deinococcus budaensis]|uniref:Uncharacterized protein n=1 Tax=Deinococcus budaensis TaxID=1665626 RepID=A0A7W8LR17_9DEIO|nr:Ig domain-containing protein [Deinococcus budaensis]MBB5235443.1 hypothetical protein [Deinococcus budaensis]